MHFIYQTMYLAFPSQMKTLIIAINIVAICSIHLTSQHD